MFHSSACQGTAKRWVSFCFLLCSFLAWLSFNSCSRPSCLCFFLSARCAIFSRNARRALFADWSSSISARISFSTSKENHWNCESTVSFALCGKYVYNNYTYIYIIYIRTYNTYIIYVRTVTFVFAIHVWRCRYSVYVLPRSSEAPENCVNKTWKCRHIRLRPLIAAAWLHGLCTRARINFTGGQWAKLKAKQIDITIPQLTCVMFSSNQLAS